MPKSKETTEKTPSAWEVENKKKKPNFYAKLEGEQSSGSGVANYYMNWFITTLPLQTVKLANTELWTVEHLTTQLYEIKQPEKQLIELSESILTNMNEMRISKFGSIPTSR